MILGLVIAASVLVFDQLTKFWMLNYVLNERPGIELTSFFNLVYAWNTGVSFSMCNASGAHGTLLLCLMAALIVAALLWWLYREKARAVQIGLGMIIGGALGNLVDRVRLGAVSTFWTFIWACTIGRPLTLPTVLSASVRPSSYCTVCSIPKKKKIRSKSNEEDCLSDVVGRYAWRL